LLARLIVLLCVILIVASGISISFFARHVLYYVNPIIFSDLQADAAALLGETRAASFIFGFHNEHIVATTRALSVVDYFYFGAQYRLHQIASFFSLVICTTSFIFLLLRERISLIPEIGIAAFLTALMFSPPMLPLVGFPYFLTHPLTTVLALAVASASTAIASSGSSWAALTAAFVFSLLTLVSGAHGFALAISAIALPIFLGWRRTSQSGRLSAIALGVMILALWATLLAPAHPANGAFSPSRLMAVAAYALRVLGTPAYFALPDPTIGVGFGLLVLAFVTVALLSAFHRRPATPLIMIAAALLVGHMLSIILIALGRAGTEWTAETEKYHYYTVICVVTSGLILWRVWRERAAVMFGVPISGLAFLSLTFLQQPGALVLRTFFKGTEVAGTALALDVPDPQLPEPSYDHQAPYYRKLQERQLNLYRRPPINLISLDVSALPQATDCRGHLDVKMPFVAVNGRLASRLEGWAIAFHSPSNASVLVVSGGKVVGAGIFYAPRVDVIRHFGIKEVAEDVAIGWKGYVASEMVSAPLALYVLSGDGKACEFFSE